MKVKFFTLALSLIALTASAQIPSLDISVVDNGNSELEVVLRPDGPFDEVFSSLVFTIRWDAVDAATLGNVAQVLPEAIYMPLAKSGPMADAGGYNYQVFAGFGSQQMQAFGGAFVGGMEVTLMTIPVVGMSTFEIVNDAWTGDQTNNGDFYGSLNGVDATGIIYGGAVSTDVTEYAGTGTATVTPNPSGGQVQLQINDQLNAVNSVELLNALGQTVRVENVSTSGSTHVVNMDLSDYDKGPYYFRIVRDNSAETVPFVLR